MWNVLQTNQTNPFVPLVIGECGTEIIATFNSEAEASAYADVIQEDAREFNRRIVVRQASPGEYVTYPNA